MLKHMQYVLLNLKLTNTYRRSSNFNCHDKRCRF